MCLILWKLLDCQTQLAFVRRGDCCPIGVSLVEQHSEAHPFPTQYSKLNHSTSTKLPLSLLQSRKSCWTTGRWGVEPRNPLLPSHKIQDLQILQWWHLLCGGHRGCSDGEEGNAESSRLPFCTGDGFIIVVRRVLGYSMLFSHGFDHFDQDSGILHDIQSVWDVKSCPKSMWMHQSRKDNPSLIISVQSKLNHIVIPKYPGRLMSFYYLDLFGFI